MAGHELISQRGLAAGVVEPRRHRIAYLHEGAFRQVDGGRGVVKPAILHRAVGITDYIVGHPGRVKPCSVTSRD